MPQIAKKFPRNNFYFFYILPQSTIRGFFCALCSSPWPLRWAFAFGFSASPRLRGATGFLRVFSVAPCRSLPSSVAKGGEVLILSSSVFLCVLCGKRFLVVALLRCVL